VNTDDLIAQMKADDLEGATKLTPVQYGRKNGIAPQLVYYHIKKGHLKVVVCECGRRCIDVEETDKLFAELEAKKNKGQVKADENG
jgi:hypothetical protein